MAIFDAKHERFMKLANIMVYAGGNKTRQEYINATGIDPAEFPKYISIGITFNICWLTDEGKKIISLHDTINTNFARISEHF